MKRFVLALFATSAMLVAQLAQPTTKIEMSIPAGTAVSLPINLGTCVPVAFVLPTMSPAADFTFQSSTDGVTFTDVWDAFGSEVTVNTGPGTTARTVVLSVSDFYYTRHLKVRRGTAATPINTTLILNFSISCKQ